MEGVEKRTWTSETRDLGIQSSGTIPDIGKPVSPEAGKNLDWEKVWRGRESGAEP